MKLYLQTLRRRHVSEQEQSDFYRFMLEDLDRLDRLINQLLDAGRLESGRTEPTWKMCRWPPYWKIPGRPASAIACRPTASAASCNRRRAGDGST